MHSAGQSPVTPTQSLDAFGWSLDVPTALLFVMLALIVVLLWRADLGPRWAEAFQDDGGKVSALRLSIFIAIAVSSWHLIYVTMNVIKTGADLNELYPFYATFLGVWSGAKVAEKALDAILAKFGVRPIAAQQPAP
jgi:hypothetical protein